MQISNRLKSIANFISKDDIIADVGCDHALLDIYLVKNNICDRALVCDINENALNNGINNIQKYHLEDKITARLGDGISVIDDDINTLIISGMGAYTILKILDNPKLNKINKLVIQSNGDYGLLRKEIIKLGFYIDDEEAVLDNDKYYVTIVFKRGYHNYSKKELLYGPYLINKAYKYYDYLYNNNLSILSKIPKNKIMIRIKVINENRILKKLRNRTTEK